MTLKWFDKVSSTNFSIITCSLLIIAITAMGDRGLGALGLFAPAVDNGEIWRLVTANLVHFGWAHSAMNLAAFLLCSYIFFSEYPLRMFLTLLFISFLTVGLGIYFFNPDYMPYAGLSGSIHGLIAAGLLLTKDYPLLLKIGAGILFLGKLVQENTHYFDSTDLQQLIGAQVAVEAHLYGVAGGLLYVLLIKIMEKTR